MGRNVLFIGNGFDRALGLKTDYVSWINYYWSGISFSDEIEDFDLRLIYYFDKHKDDPNPFLLNELQPPVKENEYKYFDKIYSEKFKIYYDKDFRNIGKESLSTWKRNLKEYNLWMVYFRYLQTLKENSIDYCETEYIDKKGNWLDIETTIENIISDNGWNLIILLTKVIYSPPIDEEEHFILSEFKKFKSLLVEYLTSVTSSSYANNYIAYQNFDGEMLSLNNYEIINFNYTNSLYLLENKSNFRKVHGDLTDNSNIVFGGNQKYIAQNDKININPKFKNTYFDYTKMFQLLELNGTRNYSFNSSQIESITILGHSLSQQDYNYFFSILDNNNNIKINLCYYPYKVSNGWKNNRVDSLQNMYKLLEAYEEYSKKNVAYTLNFEGRISLRKVKIPDLTQINYGVDIQIQNNNIINRLLKITNDTPAGDKQVLSTIESAVKNLIKHAEFFGEKKFIFCCRNYSFEIPFSQNEQGMYLLNNNLKNVYYKHVTNQTSSILYLNNPLRTGLEWFDSFSDMEKLYKETNLDILLRTKSGGMEIIYSQGEFHTSHCSAQVQINIENYLSKK